MRKLAYEYGQKLLPRKQKFESLYYALDLNSPCNGEALMEMKLNAASIETQPRELSASAIYVSPDGDDSSKGTEAAPLKSIQKALDTAAASKVASVVLRKGIFFLDRALNVGQHHSGITVTAYPSESPVISGGKMLKTSWTAYNVSQPGNASFIVKNDDNIVDKAKIDNKTVALFGKTVNATACQAACKAEGACTGFTWHDKHQKSYAYKCIFRLDGKHVPYTQTGHVSGWTQSDFGKNIYVADLSGQVDSTIGVPGLQLVDSSGAITRATRARFPNLPGEYPLLIHDSLTFVFI
jgi:hypothetical protein